MIPSVLDIPYPKGREWKSTSFFPTSLLKDRIYEQHGETPQIKRRRVRRRIERSKKGLDAWLGRLSDVDRANTLDVIQNLYETFHDDPSTHGLFVDYIWIHAIGSTLLRRNYNDIDLLVVSNMDSNALGILEKPLGKRYKVKERWSTLEPVEIEDEIYGWSGEKRKVLRLLPNYGGKPIEVTFHADVPSPLNWLEIERKHMEKSQEFLEQCLGRRLPLVYAEADPALLLEEILEEGDGKEIRVIDGQKVLVIQEYSGELSKKEVEDLSRGGVAMHRLYDAYRNLGLKALHPKHQEILLTYFSAESEDELPRILPEEQWEALQNDPKLYGRDVRGQQRFSFMEGDVPIAPPIEHMYSIDDKGRLRRERESEWYRKQPVIFGNPNEPSEDIPF